MMLVIMRSATYGHDEIDEGDGIEGDLPPVHEAAKVEDDQDDHQQVDARGDQVEAHQDKGDNEDGSERDGEGLEGVPPHC